MDNWPASPYRQMVVVDPVSCDNINIVALAILIL
jgi:hypothetical protein